MTSDPVATCKPAPAAAGGQPPPGRAVQLALLAVLLLAATLRLWHLDQNGFGRQYYAAGVRSMLGSLHNFLYNSFDPAGFVSLDKPPVALWMQVLSAKLLGFSAFSVMLPQVLEGLVSVALLHHLVARRFGQGAGLLSALFLALTPISVAIDRSNNTDSCLVMVLLLATWALLRAAETGSGRLLVLAMALVGVGFNVKMAAALVVAPTFCLVYLCSAPGLVVRQRLAQLGMALVAMVLLSLSWVTAFDLTPPDQRPYAGSTAHNSMLELALLHNGLDRFVPRASRDAPGQPADTVAPPPTAPASSSAATTTALWDRTPVGPLRLATPHIAAQMGWWLPLAIAGALLGGAPWLRRRLTADQATVLLWGGWALTYGAAFSFAGGVFHTYYVAVLGPPLAALAGIGASLLWQRRGTGAWPWEVPAVLLALAAWHAGIDLGHAGWQFDGWRGLLLLLAVGLLLLTGAVLLLLPTQQAGSRMHCGLAVLALAAMLVMPLAWGLSTVLARPNVAAPAADLGKLAAIMDDDAEEQSPAAAPARPRSQKLMEFLRVHRRSERFMLAVPNAQQAAPLIVRTGEPVMAMGGYLGRDPILTPAALERMVADGEVRYAIVGGPALVPPDTRRERALAHWIRTHGRRVDPALWREPPDPNRPPPAATSRTRAPARLYDLRPDLADAQAEDPGQ